MATSKSIAKLSTLGNPIDGGKKNPLKPISDNELSSFSNFANSTDTKEMAKYLMKKGLAGASQLYTDHPDISKKEGIINAQSDWKPNAIMKMLGRARQLGLKTPAEINANKDALMGTLDGRIKQAITHPAFNQIHPNWWQTFDTILKERYDSENTPQPSISTHLAVK